MAPAALDEVSEAIASLFSAHGQAYQALSAQVARLHDQFVQAMNAGANLYASAEAANVSPLQAAQGALGAPGQALAASSPGSPLQQLEAAQISVNSALVNNELGFNHWLLTNEVGLEQRFFGTDSALNGVINRGFNVGNLLVGTGEQALNTVVGAQVPANFISSLLTGSGAQVFNGGQIGGLAGAFDQSLVVNADLAGLVVGATPASGLLPVSPDTMLHQLETSHLNFNSTLVNNELGFNHWLLTNEVGLEQRFFGTDSALNGVINRGFNVGNLLVGTGEQALNTVVGAQVPANFISSLLTGSGAQVFNGGQIGGLAGAFDQSLMVAADLAGLVTGR
ncbi:PE-PGRS family protein PE_PGRS18 [Mycobacterium attenuatum]|uniref:PE-PGRS family protein PE_PGRS18 n=1 Tax=Mycobacterium attenuatum TaxID=2341086 RepID=A0A498Q848_9MYCO|nr:PE-PGRS family protein PE_PGRS18 [Mycobacterium attenuatum]